VETAIGVFTSRDRAEEALKELLQNNVPEEAIVFLTRSEGEAMTLAKEVGGLAGGFAGGAVGLGAGMVVASLAIIPGIGQVFAIGVGATALLGFLGRKTGVTVGKHIAKETDIPAPVTDEESSEDAQTFLEVLKTGRSLIVVRTESRETAKIASGILDHATLSAQSQVTTKMRAGVRQVSAGVTAVDVKGRIVVGEGNLLLRETIQKLVDEGINKVVLVLREVEHIDSSGIGEIVRAHTLIRKSNGLMKIADPSPKVHEMLQMTMLHKVLEVYPDEMSAVTSFGTSTAKA
jgi:anti-sigma B factor antagonist